MDKEKLEELEGLKEDLKIKYEENFKLDNNSVIIILDEDEDAESTVEFVTIINLIINLGEKYNYTFIGISEFATTVAENLTLLKFTRARTL
ncbi:hypothetical protein [Fusobacterium polymorphum]|jgi:hypothetical protein|uniref:Uncharacterized protein n=1 Tax=Fusobacterium nucleatum subsp. polymorphum TaxID=76857 RepID=A0AAC8WHS2_FUSNP|nr:hypothetical protein [Fusobacterium polymorphum]ALM95429.1 hypothetical protein RO02_12545 [Fusobacterium polymorphum]